MSHSLQIVDELTKLYQAKDRKIVEVIVRYNSVQGDHGINPWYVLNMMRDDVPVEVARDAFTPHQGPSEFITIFETQEYS
jgi:hypothetical protein